MNKKIDSENQTIKTYFESKNEFYIPSYQRPYAWQVSQCEKLIEDIERHQENFDKDTQDNYFFGTVLIAQETGEEHEVALIDGQQRTTTFMLLLKALLLRIKEELVKISPSSLEGERLRDKLISLKGMIIKMLYHLNDDDEYLYTKRDEYQLQPIDIKYVNDSISELHKDDFVTILLGESYFGITDAVKKIEHRRKDNKYTNFFKNFRYFYRELETKNNLQLAEFAEHFVMYCQVIAITSYNTDQAINIFNSLNGTGLPLTPIEVIVSQTTANAKERKVFEENWWSIVEKTDHSRLNLNSLITHYIFVKLAQFQSETRNPGVSAFFNKNNQLLREDVLFTMELDQILTIFESYSDSPEGMILDKFNNNLKPFATSFQFYKGGENEFLIYLIKLGALLDLSESPYSSSKFKGFLEKINLKFSKKDVAAEEIISEMKKHIASEFNKQEIEETLLESGVPTSLVYLNDYLYAKEKGEIFSISNQVDIEHIMSQSGQNRENIMADAGFTDASEFKEYAEKLGNKILLEADINRAIGDSWFRTKKMYTIADKKGYVGSRYVIAKSLTNYPKETWDKEDIDKATIKAAKRITDFIFYEN